MPPTAKAGVNPGPFTYAALPAGIALNGSSSTPGAGASSITEWSWQTMAKPTASALSLTGANTATPTGTVDAPGTVLFWLRVKNDLDEWSAANTQEAFIAAWEDESDESILVVEVSSQHLALVIKASGEHNYWTKDEAWFLAVDAMRGELTTAQADITTLQGAVTTAEGDIDDLEAAVAAIDLTVPPPECRRYITYAAGSASADGSAASPYNATSAAGASKAGPWQQAIDELYALTLPPGTVRTIVAQGSYDETVAPASYSEDVNIPADGPWKLLCDGVVIMNPVDGSDNHTIHFTIPETPSALCNLQIGPLNGALLGPATHAMYVHAIQLTAAYGGAARIDLDGLNIGSVTVSGTFAAGPYAYLRGCHVTGAFVVPNLVVGRAEDCAFDSDVEVKTIDYDRGSVYGGNVTITQAPERGFFNVDFSSDNSFNGPASSAKFCPVTRANFVAADMSYAGGAGVDDLLKVGDLNSGEAVWNLRGANDVRMDAVAGDATVSADSGLATVQGDKVAATATSSAGDAMSLVSGGGATVTAGGQASLTGATALVTATSGDTTVQSTNGDVVVEAPSGEVQVTAADAVGVTAGGAATITGGDAAILTAVNNDATVQSTNQDVVLKATASGKAMYVLGKLKAVIGAAVSPVKGVATRVPNVIHCDGGVNDTPGTGENTVLSISLPAYFFADGTAGNAIKGDFIAVAADTANNKTVRMKLGGTTLWTWGPYAAQDRNLLFEYRLWDAGSGVLGWWWRVSSSTPSTKATTVLMDYGTTSGLTFSAGAVLAVTFDLTAADDLAIKSFHAVSEMQ